MNNIYNNFFNAMQGIKGKICWGTVAGEGTGSHVAIDIGEKYLQKIPLKNKHLTEEQRYYEAEYSFLIYCTWRLDSSRSVICGSNNSNKNDGPMVMGLKRLIDKKIVDIEIVKPAYDLYIFFEKGLTLRIFCDETDHQDGCDNYTFYTPTVNYSISNKNKIEFETVASQ